MKLLMTYGLPASGKTTFAKGLVATQANWKRVNKDDLRAMLDAGKWSSQNEKFILQVRDYLIGKFLNEKYNVVVDDTNLDPKHKAQLQEIAKLREAEVWADIKGESRVIAIIRVGLDSTEANANLIVAAPDLLKGCLRAIQYIKAAASFERIPKEVADRIVKELSTTVKKAEGK